MSAFLKNKITDLETRINNMVVPTNSESNDELKNNFTELKTSLRTNTEKIESFEKDFSTFKNLTNDNTKNTSSNLQTLSNNLSAVGCGAVPNSASAVRASGAYSSTSSPENTLSSRFSKGCNKKAYTLPHTD